MQNLTNHLQALGCKYLNAGCFAAGTPLWTPGGYRAIETLVPGELVYSRDEWNPTGDIEAKVIEEVFTRYAGVYHLHLGGQVIGTSGEHPFYVAGRGWTAVHELQAGDRVLCADGSTVRVEEVYDTGEWQLVYNLRVADHHTYFVGDESWGWCAWAHNAYSWKELEGASYNFGTGRYMTVTNSDSNYNRLWWKPDRASKPRLATEPCPDDKTGLGDQIRAKAQELADGWTAKDEQTRYDVRLGSTINPRLNKINAILTANSKPAVTLDEIDKQGKRFPVLASPDETYNSLIKNFWFHRSVAIGMYVHNGCRDAFDGKFNLEYKTTGPDFILSNADDAAKKTYFEIIPDTASSRSNHANRTMKDFIYRVVYYNRGVINNPTDADFDEE